MWATWPCTNPHQSPKTLEIARAKSLQIDLGWAQLGPGLPPTWAQVVLFWTQLEPKSPIGHVGPKFQSDPDGPQIEAM